MTARCGLFVLLAVAGFALLAAADPASPMMPLALTLLIAAMAVIATVSTRAAGAAAVLVGYAVRSAAADRSGSSRQRDPDAPGHVRARAPGIV
jgi:hypothetical protein